MNDGNNGPSWVEFSKFFLHKLQVTVIILIIIIYFILLRFEQCSL